MVKNLTIGVISIQGAISEHIFIMENALKANNQSGKVILIKNKDEFDKIDAMIIPGGETTTISKVLYKYGLYHEIQKIIDKDDLPIMGTCAGSVILASEISDNDKDIKPFSAMDIRVKRNAFGRQRESFEYKLDIKGFSKPYNAVFIRAPAIEKVWNDCEVLASIGEKIVMAKQGNYLALSFHPELTDDLRIHRLFLNMIKK
jgi:5'-phosphate synthase pdxT subunit